MYVFISISDRYYNVYIHVSIRMYTYRSLSMQQVASS